MNQDSNVIKFIEEEFGIDELIVKGIDNNIPEEELLFESDRLFELIVKEIASTFSIEYQEAMEKYIEYSKYLAFNALKEVEEEKQNE